MFLYQGLKSYFWFRTITYYNVFGLWISTEARIIKISCCVSWVFSISISLIANQPVAGSIIVFAGKMHFYLITFSGCNGVGTNSVYLHYVPRNDILLPILLRMRFLILAPLVCTCYVKCLMWREYFSIFVMYYYHLCWRPVVSSIVIVLRPMVVSVLYLLKTRGLLPYSYSRLLVFCIIMDDM